MVELITERVGDMQVMVFKCEKCGFITEDEVVYLDHVRVHASIDWIRGRFPVPERYQYPVQRSKIWLEEYKKAVETVVSGVSYTPWSYAWFRVLDDQNSLFYPVTLRALEVCTVCFLEHNQRYDATHCCNGNKLLWR